LTNLRLRADDLSWREIDDEVIAVDVETSTYLGTNQAGALLWERLANGGATPQQLADVLVEAYGIDAERARVDVEAFVADLATRRLLAS
jgi:hypothetical protein